MKVSLLFFALLACGLTASAQTNETQPADAVPFPRVPLKRAQELAGDRTISLHLRDVSLLAALQELERQCDFALDLSNLPEDKLATKMSIDIDTPSFKRAFESVADEANVKLVFSHGWTLDPWRVVEAGPLPALKFAPTVSKDLFLIRLAGVNVTFSKTLDLKVDPNSARTQNDNLNLTFELAPDPNLSLGGLGHVVITRAETDTGVSLLDPQRKSEPLSSNSGFVDVWSQPGQTLLLSPPLPDARAIAHLQGEAIYAVIVEHDNWEIPDFLGAKSEKLTHNLKIGEHEVTATVSDVARSQQGIDLKIQLKLPEGENWDELAEYYSVYPLFSWYTIEDATGKKLLGRGSGGNNSNNRVSATGTFSLQSSFDSNGEQVTPKLTLPLKFTFAPPTQWVQTEIPFSFENVPLP